MALTQNQKVILSKASRSMVVSVAEDLRRYHSKSRWLGNNNRYLRETTDRIELDVKTPPLTKIKQKHLREYVTASTALHCADGWSFLGRSVEALARGDIHAARHMAYYAELRAAVGLLAGEGIGVFRNKHIVIESSGTVTVFPAAQTHEFTWDALDWWSSTSAAALRLGQVIKPFNSPFDGWVTPFPALLSAAAGTWLKEWGLDLQRFYADKKARNVSSYRPQSIPDIPVVSPDTSVSFIRDLWTILEPYSGNRFDGIDRYLLRASIRQQSVPSDLRVRISRICAIMPSIQISPADLRAFMQHTGSPPDPSPFLYAGKKDSDYARDHPLQVISRATLMLRVATGSITMLLGNAGISQASLAFWCRILANRRGFIEESDALDNPSELWADVGSSLDLLRTWLGKPKDQRGGTKALLDAQMSSAIWAAGGCERVALWSLPT